MTRGKKILAGVALALLLLLGGVSILIGTTRGLHLLLHSASRWVPGFSIAKVQGGWRDLTLRQTHWQMPGVAVNIGEIHLALRPACLKKLALCVDDLSVKEVGVAVDSAKLPPSSPESKDKGHGEISTPFPLTLRHVSLHNLSVKVDNTEIALADFSGGLHWQGRSLTLTPVRIQNLLVTLPDATTVAKEQLKKLQPPAPPHNEKPLGEILRTRFATPLLPNLPDFHLPLDINIQQISGEQLRVTGVVKLLVNQLQLKASMSQQHLQLQTLKIVTPQGYLNASGQANAAGNWPLDFSLNSALNFAPLRGEKINLRLNGAMRQQTKLALSFTGPVRAQLTAQTALATSGLPLQLAVNAPRLRWPLSGNAQYQLDDLAFRLSGKATNYLTSLHAALRGATIPATTIQLAGKGNIEQFSLDRLRLDLLQGHIDFSALVNWSKAVSWRSELTLEGINTAQHYPDWPAKLQGKITTRGSLHGGSWQMRVPRLELRGNIRQNALVMDGSLYGNSYSQWDIPGIRLLLGRNQINIKGKLKDNVSLDADIDAPGLDNVLPGLGGRAKGHLSARGSLKAPHLLADLTAERLRWQDMRIDRVSIKGEGQTGDTISGKLAVLMTQLKQDKLTIDRLAFNADGNEKQHRLTLILRGEPVAGELTLNGSFNRQQQRWQGVLSDTRFDTPTGVWRLTRAMNIDYLNEKQTVTLSAHCWLNPNAQLCLPQPASIGPEGHVRVALNRFDLAMLKPLLPEETQLAGSFSGDGEVSWLNNGKLPEGRLTLRGNGVKVTQRMQENTLPVAFDTLNLNAALRNGQAQLGWLVRIAGNGQFAGDVRVSDPRNQRNLSGNINLTRFSLAMFDPLLAPGEKITGEINSNLQLGGNLQHPLIYGQLNLREGDINGDFMPVDLTAATLNMRFNGTSSTLAGVLQTSRGQVALNGDADWRQLENWRARITAHGDRVRVTKPPMITMEVSPDLVFEATPAAFNLGGKVDIPWARITMQNMPNSATAVSPDEVMLDKNLKPVKEKSAAIAINSSLIIHVGKDVRLDAFGLKARLNGDLKLVQDKHGLGLNGQINIPSGRFHAYGQDLLVRKGELQFAGPPDQPYINLEAIRNPEATEDDVIAGLRVTGLADEPKAEVFSDPAMSQQEALSYLLRGQGLSSDGDSNALTSALIGLGVARSGQVVGKIGETFGISHLSLDTAGVGDSQQVQVSGYVLPGLQVKYGVGIFDSLATLTLRYRLMPRLYLEAVSGIDQALDLLYQFEF